VLEEADPLQVIEMRPHCESIRCTDVAVNGEPLLLMCPASARAVDISRSESRSPLRRRRASL
jgi:hypothetical protein